MAYKVFTNGSPLPASDLNTYLMNQSVMVFANSAARSSALTSPTEGMTTYLEDTNKIEVWTGSAWTDINDNTSAIPKSTVTTTGDLIVANGNASVTRLGIGTNGQVLQSNGTTATWATLAAPGASWSLVTNASLPGATSVSITSIGSYDKYLLMVDCGGSASADVFVDINGNTSSYRGYGQQFVGASSYGPSTVVQDYNVDGGTITLGKSNSGTTQVRIFAGLLVTAAQSSGFKQVLHIGAGQEWSGNSGQTSISSLGMWENTSAITSFTLRTNGASFNVGGYRLYGSN